ncbi:haloacid dehalogenase type II [Desertihabitans aurantiacus]|uniref:haloacid dehalogenase type II n=1 Tax=Desertihabitans aurantiacus TaxID=2282477 RepID=UPI001E424C86|nr:haloacid dehalogenase type II [Desertihabitans aurantiacus]
MLRHLFGETMRLTLDGVAGAEDQREERRIVVEGIDAVVLDVLGTLVDEPAGLRSELRTAIPGLTGAQEQALVTRWQEYVAAEQRKMERGERSYAVSDVVDAEAAQHVVDGAGGADQQRVARLATASHRLPPWPDSAGALEALSARVPVVGLSNASSGALLRLSHHAGLRWHQVLSGEAVRAYKPSRAVYRYALDVVGSPPERVLMVAAHAWDLRAAQAAGMRTAFIDRPVADAPLDTDHFDLHLDGLAALADVLDSGSRP